MSRGGSIPRQLEGLFNSSGGLSMEARRRATESALMTPAEVAALFRVDPKTVGRWARAGKLGFVTTAGGHRRFFRDQVMEMLGETQPTEEE